MIFVTFSLFHHLCAESSWAVDRRVPFCCSNTNINHLILGHHDRRDRLILSLEIRPLALPPGIPCDKINEDMQSR
jgi:hypothetical protein